MKELTHGIPLYTQDTLLKYIGGMHSYLKHTILMFSPSNFDEVCVQETHIEIGGGNTSSSSKKEFASFESNKKGKKAAIVKKEEGEKPTCSHCQKKGHADAKCWKLHPELKPKWFRNNNKGKQKTMAVVQDLGSNSDD